MSFKHLSELYTKAVIIKNELQKNYFIAKN